MSAKKIVITSSIILGIAAIGTGLAMFYKRQLELAMGFCYKFSNLKFISTTADRMTIDLTIKIRNQSDIRLLLENYNFQVFINGKFITNINSTTTTDILAKAVSLLTVRIDFSPKQIFNFSDVLRLIATALTDKRNFLIQIKGNISAKANFINIKNLPIDMTMSLADILAPTDPATELKKMDCKIV